MKKDVSDMIDMSIDETFGGALIYKRDLIVPPKEARGEIIKFLHMAHQGGISMYRTARQLYYWDGMKSQIKNYYESCGTCKLNKKSKCPTKKVQNTEAYIYLASSQKRRLERPAKRFTEPQ